MDIIKPTEVQNYESVFCVFKNCDDDISSTLRKAFREFLKGKIIMNESIEENENKM